MTPIDMEDYFAHASDRLLSGESLERIIVDYPAAVRQELQALLAVVELADQVAMIKPPQRIPVNRIAARVEFSQRVAAKRAELEAAQTTLSPATPSPVTPSAAPTPRTQSGGLAEVWRKLAAVWAGLGAPAPVMRLAPLTLLLIALYVSTFTVVATAQAALPGDLAYPVKSWMREQRVATAPAAQQPAERWRADQEQAEDVAARAEQLQSEPGAEPLTAVSILQFRGFEGDQLLLGDLKVIPWYRPEGGAEDEWLPITIDGELQPGAVVMLRYQIVPGASDAVQGIALSVMQAPPMPTPAPTATPAEARHCQRIQAPNWVAYVVKSGETLSSIAARSQTSVAELRRVNCLTDGVLRAGTTIFVPNTILGALPPAPPPAVATAIATQPPPPTATPPAPTVTPAPPTSAPTITPGGTETQGGDAEATPTATPDAGTATPTPTVSATAETTPATTTTPEASATTAPTTPVATDTPTTPAGTVTELPATATEPPATATELPATATEPPATATELPATATELPATATELPATATSAASTATSVAPAMQNTDAPPTATQPPPTPVPPTPVPPTPVPPTPVPPTPVPPTPVPPTPTDASAGDVNPAATP
jgi:LysM repeat protein